MIRIALPLLLPLGIAISTWAGPLHDAAKSGDVSAVEQLVGQGVDVNVKGKNDATPLIVAALEGQTAVSEMLIALGADIHARNKAGLTPLHAAAYKGHREVVELLIAKGANINDATNDFRLTPLHAAAEENHMDVAKMLIAKGANLHVKEASGYTPVSRACFRGHKEMIRLLRQHGATCQPASLVGDDCYRTCVKLGTNQ